MERQLTSFQRECEKRLTAALARAGLYVTDRRLDGVSETYITGSLKGADVTFWIYEDGACIYAGRKRRHFEQLDYDSLDDLGNKFIHELVVSPGGSKPATCGHFKTSDSEAGES